MKTDQVQQFSTDAKLKWEVLDREPMFCSPIFTLFRSNRRFPLPQFGPEQIQGDFYYLQSKSWVTIIPLIPNRKTKEYEVILVEQFRHGSEKMVLEFPAGIIDKGEEPKECALRELAEETGYAEVECCCQLGVSYPNPAIMSAQTYTYGAVLKENSAQQALCLDELEVLQTHQMPLGQLKKLIFSANSPFSSALMLQAMFWLENSSLLRSL